MRREGCSWAELEEHAAKCGYPLTRDQMKYGWKKAKLSFLVFASPWVRRAAEDLIDNKFPDLEVAAASLAEEVALINEVGALQEGAVRDYEASAPEEGERLSPDELTARNELLQTALRLTQRRYDMQSRLLRDIAEYRKLWVATVPHEVMEELTGGEGEEKGAAKLLAVTDMDVFWRESRRAQAIMRREYEVIIDMLRRGENVPELKPLGPGDEQIIEGVRNDGEEERTDA